MNTRIATSRTTPMPTIVHTMLVRVGSMVCWGRVASASAGVVTSGWGATEPSAEGCSGTPASGRSALMVVLLARSGRSLPAQPAHAANQATCLDSGRANSGRPSLRRVGTLARYVRLRSCRTTLRGNEAGSDCRPRRRGRSTPPRGHEPCGGWVPAAFKVAADYERLSAVRAAGRAGDESASWPQSPGLTARPSLRPWTYLFADAACSAAGPL